MRKFSWLSFFFSTVTYVHVRWNSDGQKSFQFANENERARANRYDNGRPRPHTRDLLNQKSLQTVALPLRLFVCVFFSSSGCFPVVRWGRKLMEEETHLGNRRGSVLHHYRNTNVPSRSAFSFSCSIRARKWLLFSPTFILTRFQASLVTTILTTWSSLFIIIFLFFLAPSQRSAFYRNTNEHHKPAPSQLSPKIGIHIATNTAQKKHTWSVESDDWPSQPLTLNRSK